MKQEHQFDKGKEDPSKKSIEEEEKEQEMIKERLKNFDWNSWQKRIQVKKNTPRSGYRLIDPGAEELKKIKENEAGVFLGKKDFKATVRNTQNPSQKGSFGYIDINVRVESPASFFDGILIIPFDSKKLKGILKESIRAFRWDEKLNRYEFIH